MTISLDRLTALAEASEAAFMYAYESGTPAPAAAWLGITTARIGGGVALAMRNDPTGYWSKAVGFGVTTPVTAEVVGAVAEHFRAYGNDRAVLQIAPSLLPENWTEICERYGLSRGTNWMKLAARPQEVRAASTRLRVAPVGPEDMREWAELVLDTFGMPRGPLTDMLVAAGSDPDFFPYGAWDGDRVVGAGNLHVHGEVGSLNTGATHPDYRNQGVQSALIAARAAKAAELGCAWVVSETGAPPEGTKSPSLENMRRLGMRELYVRANWIWER